MTGATPPKLMNNWTIEYFNSNLERTILTLPEGLLSRYLYLIDLMQEVGANLGMPYTRSMGEGLFEMRLSSREGKARVF
jgi:phage-related protein